MSTFEAIEGGLFVERAPAVTSSRDPGEGRRAAIARGIALLLHAAVFLVSSTLINFAVEPNVIPVELVFEPAPLPKIEPPKLKPPPQAQPAPPLPTPSAAPPEQALQKESGGSPDLKAGSTRGNETPKPSGEGAAPAKTQTASSAPLPVPKPVPANTQPASEPAQSSSAFLVPQAAQKAPPQVASLPPTATPKNAPSTSDARQQSRLSSPELDDSPGSGEGGGDRYLNALRDEIVSKIIYPAAAQGASGVTRYEIVISRQGYLLRTRLRQSSGSTALDRAGMDAIQNSTPFQPLPFNIRGNAVAIDVTLYIQP